MDTEVPAILPLPQEVVAQIKSSTTITSLPMVIQELIRNALDADASSINISVDFKRGGCTVEDDGSGIHPGEFQEAGGLGKLHYTSKLGSSSVLHGFRGSFLASLAALSLLSITSRHKYHRSTNSLLLQHSKVVSRKKMNAFDKTDLLTDWSTRVVVRDLFGTMPVRVKQRALAAEDFTANDREWEQIKHGIASLLIPWNKRVEVVVKDVDRNRRFAIRGRESTENERDQIQRVMRWQLDLTYIRSVLTQATYISPTSWESWERLSAYTSKVSIMAAISLDPAPTKNIQFISLGARPLEIEHGRNVIYEEVNKVFAASRFGTSEDEAEIDAAERDRRLRDKRFKRDGINQKQMQGGRKGVDRWPMFYIRIDLKEKESSHVRVADDWIENEGRLGTILRVLKSLVIAFLREHHLRPQRHNKGCKAGGDGAQIALTRAERLSGQPADALSILMTSHGAPNQLRPSASASDLARERPKKKRKLSSNMQGAPDLAEVRLPNFKVKSSLRTRSDFSTWSRIKSGRSTLFEETHVESREEERSSSRDVPNGISLPETRDVSNKAFNPVSGLADTLNVSCGHSRESSTSSCNMGTTLQETAPSSRAGESNKKVTDETVSWTDPKTKRITQFNSRTGHTTLKVALRSTSTIPSHANSLRPASAPMLSTRGGRMTADTSVKPHTRPRSTNSDQWIDQYLQKWKNPIFALTEKAIAQASLNGPSLEPADGCTEGGLCTHADVDGAHKEMVSAISATVSKKALEKAKVVAQVDGKFILVKIPSVLNGKYEEGKDMLVLIDQHAADERCRLEDLLASLCGAAPVANDPAQALTSSLGLASPIRTYRLEKPIMFTVSLQEVSLFRRHAAHFAEWGILYDTPSIHPCTSKLLQNQHENDSQNRIAVISIPPVIAERCKAESHLITELLRREAWNISKSPTRLKTLAKAIHHDRSDWVRRIATCPPDLLNMLNSRACRSAIMFNDKLSTEECEVLVERLARCIFPFQCAHGRPAMVPLVELEAVGEGWENRHIVESTRVGEFGASSEIAKWGRWTNEGQHTMEEGREDKR
ncbi:MAG: DNA mismatch repair protein [Vezdaea acicularis]|nr:MAG: DNA mismatch repair protein [Vezdaea acicularis]